MNRTKRPMPWWGPWALLLAAVITAVCAVSAYQTRDPLQFVVAVVFTAFNALMSWSAFTMREEERRARG